MRAPALVMLAARLRWAGLRHEAGTRAGPEGGAERGGWHGVRNERDAWGAELRAGWRGSCEGGFIRRKRSDRPQPTGHDFAQLFVMRSTKERSDWCQGGKGPALREGSHPTRHGDVLQKLCDGHGCWRRDSPPALKV